MSDVLGNALPKSCFERITGLTDLKTDLVPPPTPAEDGFSTGDSIGDKISDDSADLKQSPVSGEIFCIRCCFLTYGVGNDANCLSTGDS